MFKSNFIKIMGKKKIIIVLVLVIVVLSSTYGYLTMFHSDADTLTYLTAEATRGDISVSINSSGTIEASKRASIRVVKDASIDVITVTEGDRVEKEDVIMTLTDSQETGLEIDRLNYVSALNDLSELKKDLSDLKVYAPASGTVSLSFSERGKTLNSGAVFAEITDESKIEIKAPFNPAVIHNISVADTAQVLLYNYYQNIEGVVTEVGNTAKPYNDEGSLYYEVTVEIENPGALSESDQGTVTVSNNKGSYESIDSAYFSKESVSTISFDTSAELEELYISDGDFVNKGDLIAVFSSESLETQIEKQEITVSQKQLQYTQGLGDYVIKAPISGTVLAINYEEGDSVESNDTVFVISDIDTLQVVVPIDEYDIQNIQKGQTAIVTSDAYPDRTYEAEVTKIALEGTVTSGVSTFDVTLTLKTNEGLKPGMNCNAEIVVHSKEDVLLLPLVAVQKIKNNYFAALDTDSRTDEEQYIPLEVGLVSENYAEIIEGLDEGDVVKYSIALGTTEVTQNQGLKMPGMGPGPGQGGSQGKGNKRRD